MSIESVLETQMPTFGTPVGETITTVAGSVNVVFALGTEMLQFDVISWTDDAGAQRWGSLRTLAGVNGTLNMKAFSVASAVPIRRVAKSDINTPYWQVNSLFTDSAIVDADNDSPVSVRTAQDISLDEGLAIKGYFMKLPYQFTLGQGVFNISFSYLDDNGNFVDFVRTVGEGVHGTMMIVENGEIPLDALIPAPSQAGINITTDRWRLGMNIKNTFGTIDGAWPFEPNDVPTASNLNIPSLSDGQILFATLGVRVVHANTPLN